MLKINDKIRIEKIVEDYINKNNLDYINIACNLKPKDYLSLSQTEIYKEAKILFTKLKRNIFINKNGLIYVSNSDIKESIAKTLRSKYQRQLINIHLIVFKNLDKIIENGILISSNKENKKRFQYIRWEYYITPINIKNKKYIVEFDVVLRDNKEKHFRLERIYKIKKQVFDRED